MATMPKELKDSIDVPCELLGCGFTKQNGAKVSVKIKDDDIGLEQAAHVLRVRRIKVKIELGADAAADVPGQEKLDLDTEIAPLTGIAETGSLSLPKKNISTTLSFDPDDINGEHLSKFHHRSARLKAELIGDSLNGSDEE